MTKLTDTQRTILTAAAKRKNGAIEPLPAHIRGGAVTKVTHALLAAGLITKAPFTITPVGRDAVAPNRTALSGPRIKPDAAPAPQAKVEPPVGKSRIDSKQAQLIDMLKRPEGSSIEEIVEKFSWQAHTVRGAIAGALKKKLGLNVLSEKVEGGARIYRIAE